MDVADLKARYAAQPPPDAPILPAVAPWGGFVVAVAPWPAELFARAAETLAAGWAALIDRTLATVTIPPIGARLTLPPLSLTVGQALADLDTQEGGTPCP